MAHDRCLIVTFVRWNDVPRATAYDIQHSDAYDGTAVHHGGTPPIPDDTLTLVGDGPTDIRPFPAPGGRHQNALGWGAGPGSFCADVRALNAARFTVVSATSAAGASSATPGSDGTYSLELDGDVYTVSSLRLRSSRAPRGGQLSTVAKGSNSTALTRTGSAPAAPGRSEIRPTPPVPFSTVDNSCFPRNCAGPIAPLAGAA
jgi:hypothetical protein